MVCTVSHEWKPEPLPLHGEIHFFFFSRINPFAGIFFGSVVLIPQLSYSDFLKSSINK